MHTIEINIDDSIYEKFMDLLTILPKDALDITSDTESPNISFEQLRREAKHISSLETTITQILQNNHLLHFKFYKNPNRILYSHEGGTPTHMLDFKRLLTVLKNNNIKHSHIGLDVVMIEEN